MTAAVRQTGAVRQASGARARATVSQGPTALAVCALACLLFVSSRPLFHGLALVLLHVLLSVIVIRAERARGWSWAEVSPIGIISVSWTVFLALPALGAYGPARSDYRLGFHEGNITLALLLSLSAMGLLYLGYRVGTRRWKPSSPSHTGHHTPARVRHLAVLLVVGWGARLYLIQNGAFGYIEFGRVQSGLTVSILDLASGLVPFALAVLTWEALRQDSLAEGRRAQVLLAVVAVPLVVSAMIAGFKAQLFTDLTPALLVYVAIRRRVPRAIALCLAAYLVLTYTGVQAYRADIAEGHISFAQGEGVGAAATAVVNRVAAGITSNSVGQQARSLADHYANSFAGMSRNLGVILHRTPDDIPLLGIQRYLRAPLFLAPIDMLEPDHMPVDQYVNVVYLEGPPTSSSPPTQPGDLYMSGGLLAVVAGELLLGWLLGRLWLWVQGGHPERLLLYAFLGAMLVNAGEDVGNLVRGGLQAALIYGTATAWLFGRINGGPSTLLMRWGRRGAGAAP